MNLKPESWVETPEHSSFKKIKTQASVIRNRCIGWLWRCHASWQCSFLCGYGSNWNT